MVFDILTRPAPELSTEERAEVKKVAKQLLERLKELLVLDWRKASSSPRARRRRHQRLARYRAAARLLDRPLQTEMFGRVRAFL